MSNNIAGLKFDPLEGLYVEIPDGPRMIKKYLNFDDVKNIFLKNNSLDTKWEPIGCRRLIQENGVTIVILEAPAAKRKILYHQRGGDVKEYIVPMPYVVFGAKIKSNVVVKSRCYAAKSPIFDDSTQLFQFPFGNVYETGKICWGQTRIPQIEQPIQANCIPNLFFTAPFNGDLSHGAYRTYESESIGELFKRLSRLELFPYEVLISSAKSTAGQLINTLKQEGE